MLQQDAFRYYPESKATPIREEIELRQRIGSSHRENSLREIHMSGEASWAAFCRAIEPSCGNTVLDMVAGDADRCPADLPTVPMQVSMRDIVAMAHAAGMECTSASFKEQSVFMQGKIGSITSARHPILGPLLHFTPRWTGVMNHCHLLNGYSGHYQRGTLADYWLLRTWGTCTIRGEIYNYRRRRAVQRLDERWMRHTERMAKGDVASPLGRESSHTLRKPSRIASPRYSDANFTLRRPQDGDWRMESKVRQSRTRGPQNNPDEKRRKESTNGHQKSPRPRTSTGARQRANSTLEHPRVRSQSGSGYSAPDRELEVRVAAAQQKQAERTAKAKQIERDSATTHNLVNQGAVPSPYHGGARLLTQNGENPSKNQTTSTPPTPPAPPTTSEEESHQRESERMESRRARDAERRDRRARHQRDSKLADMSYFWLSQIDIITGYWATSWKPDLRNLDTDTLVGATSVIFEAILGFLGTDSIEYIDPTSRTYLDTLLFLQRGGTSYPSYAHNARSGVRGGTSYPSYAHNARSGVVSPGFYTSVQIDAFSLQIPVLELLCSYDWQVDPSGHAAAAFAEQQNIELVRLDSWLALVGRMGEIAAGNGNLLRQMPAVIELLMEEFGGEWRSIDRSANEGGLQDIQALAGSVMDFLTDEELSAPEMLFVLVAVLRTVKVGQCIFEGAGTEGLREVLHKDVQVYLV